VYDHEYAPSLSLSLPLSFSFSLCLQVELCETDERTERRLYEERRREARWRAIRADEFVGVRLSTGDSIGPALRAPATRGTAAGARGEAACATTKRKENGEEGRGGERGRREFRDSERVKIGRRERKGGCGGEGTMARRKGGQRSLYRFEERLQSSIVAILRNPNNLSLRPSRDEQAGDRGRELPAWALCGDH